MSPCQFCGCKVTGVKGAAPNVQIVCTACGAEGPTALTREEAEIRWDRRPEADHWKLIAAYLASVHAANAMEYEAKSVSKIRRARQISILTTIEKAMLDGILPEGARMGNYTNDERIKNAGSRAYNEAVRLQKIQDSQ